jgi:hypothetical protein
MGIKIFANPSAQNVMRIRIVEIRNCDRCERVARSAQASTPTDHKTANTAPVQNGLGDRGSIIGSSINSAAVTVNSNTPNALNSRCRGDFGVKESVSVSFMQKTDCTTGVVEHGNEVTAESIGDLPAGLMDLVKNGIGRQSLFHLLRPLAVCGQLELYQAVADLPHSFLRVGLSLRNADRALEPSRSSRRSNLPSRSRRYAISRNPAAPATCMSPT